MAALFSAVCLVCLVVHWVHASSLLSGYRPRHWTTVPRSRCLVQLATAAVGSKPVSTRSCTVQYRNDFTASQLRTDIHADRAKVLCSTDCERNIAKLQRFFVFFHFNLLESCVEMVWAICRSALTQVNRLFAQSIFVDAIGLLITDLVLHKIVLFYRFFRSVRGLSVCHIRAPC